MHVINTTYKANFSLFLQPIFLIYLLLLHSLFFFRCSDAAGQFNFGFADDITNQDHLLSYSLGARYSGTVSTDLYVIS